MTQGPRSVISGSTYATGKRAKAQCPVCSEVVRYRSQLAKRWDGQWVCRLCLDPKHPAEQRRQFKDAVALHHPRPKNENYSPEFGFGLFVTTYDEVGTVKVVIS